MSVVTNLMLSHGFGEGREVKAAIETVDLGNGQSFRCLTGRDAESLGVPGKANPGDFWGGGKWPETDVYACACNYFDWTGGLQRLAAIPWKNPKLVQLFVQGQDDDAWSVWMLDKQGAFVLVFDRSEAWEYRVDA